MRTPRSRRWRTREPTASVLNNLGVVQLRRGGNAGDRPAHLLLQQGVRGRPDDPDYFFNLGYAYWAGHDTQAAIYWLREAVRRDPADGDAHYVLGDRARGRGQRRRGRARKGTGAPAVVDVRAMEQASRQRSGAEGARAAEERRSSCRTGGGSGRRWRTPSSAIRKSWRSSISIAAAGCSCGKTIARRSPS